MNTMEIRKKIVQAMERGEPIDELEAQLKESRLAEQTDREVWNELKRENHTLRANQKSRL
jgi:hypothetical protein